MNKFPKIISVIAIFSIVLTAFVACENNEGTAPDTDVAPGIDISDYTIVRSEEASDELSAYVTEFSEIIKKYSGAELKVSDDFIEPGTDISKSKEILVGETSRDESVAIMQLLTSAPKNSA